MKKYLLLLLSVISYVSAMAQPEAFQYQSVLRDANGIALVSQNVGVQVSILQGPLPGTVVYSETYSTNTNSLGILTLQIGASVNHTGVFSDINWSTGDYYIKMEVDPAGGTSYVDMGTMQLLSVPYALYSKTSADAFSGNYSDLNGVPVIPTQVGQLTNDAGYITNPNDADADASNELQTLNIAGNSLSISSGNTVTLPSNTYTAGTGISVSGTNVISNLSPDQTVTLTGGGSTTISGTYPNFNISSVDNNTTYTAGSGLLLSGTQFSANFGSTLGTIAQGNHTHSGLGSPAGLTGEIQFNNNGSFGANNSLFWDDVNARMGVGLNNPNGRMVIKGSPSAAATEPLFEIKNSSGQTVFVVYNDSVRIYVDDDPAKANKGTFAVSGRNSAKNMTHNFLWVTPDSSRVYTGSPVSGFGVENITAGGEESYMRLTPANYFIGHNSGVLAPAAGGAYNSTLGYYAASGLTSGNSNIIMGYYAGTGITTGNDNVVIGYESGYNLGVSQRNILLGFRSGYSLNATGNNIFIGYEAGYSTSNGFKNIAIGFQALYSNLSGSSNVAIGDMAMHSNTDGLSNTAIGSEAMFDNSTGSSNTACGVAVLRSNTAGSWNSAYGAGALGANTTGNDNTAIGESVMAANITGHSNTAIGTKSLLVNTAGNFNVAVGAFTLYTNTASYNTAIGYSALSANTTGEWNTALGGGSLSKNTTGSQNVAAGYSSLQENLTGAGNVGYGNYSLLVNTDGNNNTAIGTSAMYSNTGGDDNTALGSSAMLMNSTGNNNIAIGANSSRGNTTGSNNVTMGNNSLYTNSLGGDNIAIGFNALYNSTVSGNVAVGTQASRNNTTGYDNTAIGDRSMYSTNIGYSNTALGSYSLYTNTGGDNNSAIGKYSLFNSTSDENTAVGYYALYRITTGSQNTAIGKDAGPGSGNGTLWCTTALGYGATPVIDYSARVGNAWVGSIGGYADWTNFSDGRYKTNVKKDVAGLDFIMKLEPVTYNLDIKGIQNYLGQEYSKEDAQRSGKESVKYTGFIAQDVEKAAQSLNFDFSGVDRPKDENGQYGLRYANFVVPIVQAIQEQQKMIEELKKENEELRKLIENK
ncbi:MAG: hypothetical protein CVU05_04840 [Bacteroidetes bacterium HGW-Bacteroidetes-21]|jgi:hypothetical protein|nr:MAG: hypothetical protein CVU05_04840 [Bacteroidetes bacterium HGW-Bacteroidetes-21]